MIQPPWDKIIQQLWVNHLSVIGINDPEHRYHELEGKRNPLFKIHNIQRVGYPLFKEPNRTVIYSERRIRKPANDWKGISDFTPLVVTRGVLLPSLVSLLCSRRQRDLFSRER